MFNISAKQYISRYFFHNGYIRQGQLTFTPRKKLILKKLLVEIWRSSFLLPLFFHNGFRDLLHIRVSLFLAFLWLWHIAKQKSLHLPPSPPQHLPPPRRGNVLNHNITASQIEPFLSSIQTLRCHKISQSPQNSCTCNLHQIEKISILKKGSKTIIVLLLVNKYD